MKPGQERVHAVGQATTNPLPHICYHRQDGNHKQTFAINSFLSSIAHSYAINIKNQNKVILLQTFNTSTACLHTLKKNYLIIHFSRKHNAAIVPASLRNKYLPSTGKRRRIQHIPTGSHKARAKNI